MKLLLLQNDGDGNYKEGLDVRHKWPRDLFCKIVVSMTLILKFKLFKDNLSVFT